VAPNIGASSRYVGRETEQRVSRHLRQYWPDCTRQVRTGWRNGASSSDDPGDLTGLPFACQVKGHKRGSRQFTVGQVCKIWTQAVKQAASSGMPFPVVIEKVMGTADVAEWFAWLTPELRDWLSDEDSSDGPDLEPWNACEATEWALTERGLIRVTVAEFVELCRATGVPMTAVDSSQDAGANTRTG
jgi:hypothetical protein